MTSGESTSEPLVATILNTMIQFESNSLFMSVSANKDGHRRLRQSNSAYTFNNIELILYSLKISVICTKGLKSINLRAIFPLGVPHEAIKN